MSSDSLSGFPDLSEEPSSLCKRFSSISCERDVFSFVHTKHVLCLQVSPIDHRLVWVWIGLVGRTLHVELPQKTVERVYRLAVVQLWNPIHNSLRSNHDCVAIFGGGRGDKYGLSYKTSPVFNLTIFGVQ